MYCSKCGGKLGDDYKFCPICGSRVIASVEPEMRDEKPEGSIGADAVRPVKPDNSNSEQNAPQGGTSGHVESPKNAEQEKHRTAESFIRLLLLAFISLAMLLAIVILSLMYSGKSNAASPSDAVSAAEINEYAEDDDILEDTTAAAGLSAEQIKSSLLGTWTTSLSYNSMSVPANITFKSDGTCTVSAKILFISKSFCGTYTLADGGSCSMTVDGIDSFTGGKDTISGKIAITDSNRAEFVTDGGVAMVLTRA